VQKLVKAYVTVNIGDPLESGVLCGPLHSPLSLKIYETAIEKIKE
jgi:aldehyde dehydrogenase family 7 protein A1